MKIEKIYISEFGKLKDFTLNLSDGFNVVFGENENGKTTVMAFIKAMFYGTGKKVQSIEQSLRIKYTPFGGAQNMGGRIFFEHENKKYCLERLFKSSDTTDKITLTDTDTGETSAVPSDIGVKFFGVGAEAFEKSMFISVLSGGKVSENAAGEINSKLSSFALTGDNDTSFSKVENRIKSAREELISKSGRTGKCVKNKEQLNELNERYETALCMANEKLKLKEKAEEKKQEGAVLLKKYNAVKKVCEAEETLKKKEKLKEFVEKKRQLDLLNEELTLKNGTVLDSVFLGKIKFCLNKINVQNEKIKDISSEIKAKEEEINLMESEDKKLLPKKINELKEKIAENSEKKDETDKKISEKEAEISALESGSSPKKTINLPLVFAGAGLLILGILLIVFINDVFYALAGLGAVLCVLGFILKKSDKKALLKLNGQKIKINEELTLLKGEKAVLSEEAALALSELNRLTAVLSADNTVKQHTKEELTKKKERLKEETEKSELQKAEIKGLFDGEEISEEELIKIEELAEKQKELKLGLSILSKDLNEISYIKAEELIEKLESEDGINNIDFNLAREEKEKLEKEIDGIKQEITAADTELKTAFRNAEQPEILKREIDLLETKIAEEEEFCSAADLALNILFESFSLVRRSYGSALEEKTLKNFKSLTEDKYKNLSVDKMFSLKVEESGSFGMHELDYLSLGAKEQAYLALRLAVCEIMSEKSGIPVMLDDALSSFDDKRTVAALKFLSEYAKNGQILLFTCHNFVKESAENLGINCFNLLKD